MTLALRSGVAIVLALGALGGVASCADSEQEPFTPRPNDTGDASFPSVPDAAVEPDAPIEEAGVRTCSIHGICSTALPVNETLRGVWGDGAGVVWSVSAEGSILRWDGAAWNIHATGLGALNAVWGSSATDIWVAGDKGVLHGTGATSSAVTFTPSSLPDAKTVVLSIWGTSALDVWAVGFAEQDTGETFPRVLHFSPGDAGAQWAIDPVSKEGLSFTHVWGSPGSGVWLAGTRPMVDDSWLNEVVVLRKHDGDAFTPEAVPDDPDDGLPWARVHTVQGAVAASDGTVWIYGRSGFPGIWKGTSADNGKTFTWSHTRDGLPSEPMWTALAGAGNDIWAVGEYGRVRRWTGTEWATTAITPTKFPIIDPLYAAWSRGSAEAWAVGKGIALRYDPAQAKDGGQ